MGRRIRTQIYRRACGYGPPGRHELAPLSSNAVGFNGLGLMRSHLSLPFKVRGFETDQEEAQAFLPLQAQPVLRATCLLVLPWSAKRCPVMVKLNLICDTPHN
jgi:hypothetical protein